jgi:hypothetical protein
VYVLTFSSYNPGVQTPQDISEIAASSMSFTDFSAWLAFRAMDAEEDE